MMYLIGYLLFSFVLIGILFYLIEHSPSGWEDENGFHTDAEPAPQLNLDWSNKSVGFALELHDKYPAIPRTIA